MRSFLINKNLSLYYLLRRRFGRKRSLVVAGIIEKALLIFGREKMPGFNENGMAEKRKSGGKKRNLLRSVGGMHG